MARERGWGTAREKENMSLHVLRANCGGVGVGVGESAREGVRDGEGGERERERERERMRLYMCFVQIVMVWELGLG